jgi:aminopeptidase N
MTLSYELSLRYPERYDAIRTTQRSRISDPDRLRRFDYIIRAVHPSKSERDALFCSLLEPQNRRIEPWAASALSYLNHPLRGSEAVEYIRPGLEELLEVQRTGDIFFPRNWVGALLSGHRSPEAHDVLQHFLEENADYPQLMLNKILQAAYPLQGSVR